MNQHKLVADCFNKYASLYQDRFMDIDLYNDTYDRFCALIKKQNANILEIGCGPGNITRYILSKRPDLHLLGIDIAADMIRLAACNNPSARFKVMDCHDLDQLGETYDGIICGFCIPYLSKEECDKLLGDCCRLLNNRGIFYFSFIEDDHDRSGMETSSDGKSSLHMSYYREHDFSRLLVKHGFESVDAARKAYGKPDGTSSTHLIMIARKK